ncbi:hypothetical protein TrVFT333_011044 [Trichoderma virens FT-333]|nr:hypothetical protein TrVFT333_011044 [Trichoderma virens FT-333]
MAIPPYSGYNIVDWHIYNRLRGLWKTESRSWSEGERRDFVEWVPKAHVTERENSILDHPLAEHMRCNRHSWGHFVILRVMFGASQCARQSWWAEFKQKYERAAEDAPPGVVPRDVDEVLLTNRMDPPPMMKIPTMEVNSVHVERDCGCSWCLKKAADKASRGNISSSQESKTVKREQRAECPRGQSIYTGEGETCEDRARRSEREQGVEPEEAQDNESEDERAGAVTQVSSLRERSTVVCTDGTSRGLREVVVEQGSMIEMLVRLVERQDKRMERLEKKVDRGQRRSEKFYRDVNRSVKDVRRMMREGDGGEEG